MGNKPNTSFGFCDACMVSFDRKMVTVLFVTVYHQQDIHIGLAAHVNHVLCFDRSS